MKPRAAADVLYAAQLAASRHNARRGRRPRRGGAKPSKDRLADPRRYIPLDVTLAWMPVRALRVLRHLGWSDHEDIAVAADLTDDGRERNALSTALHAHVAAKRVLVREIRGRYHKGTGSATLRQYRIAASGARWLEQQLRPDIDVCDDSEAAPRGWWRDDRRAA